MQVTRLDTRESTIYEASYTQKDGMEWVAAGMGENGVPFYHAVGSDGRLVVANVIPEGKDSFRVIPRTETPATAPGRSARSGGDGIEDAGTGTVGDTLPPWKPVDRPWSRKTTTNTKKWLSEVETFEGTPFQVKNPQTDNFLEFPAVYRDLFDKVKWRGKQVRVGDPPVYHGVEDGKRVVRKVELNDKGEIQFTDRDWAESVDRGFWGPEAPPAY